MEKYYITKYAISQGILLMECKPAGENSVQTGHRFPQYFHKGEFHTTMEDAQKKAEEMRVKKLASLEKQAAKIRKMKFETAKER